MLIFVWCFERFLLHWKSFCKEPKIFLINKCVFKIILFWYILLNDFKLDLSNTYIYIYYIYTYILYIYICIYIIYMYIYNIYICTYIYIYVCIYIIYIRPLWWHVIYVYMFFFMYIYWHQLAKYTLNQRYQEHYRHQNW